MKHLPIKTCPACDRSWFREATVFEYSRDRKPYTVPGADQASLMPITIVICLDRGPR